MKRLLYFSPYSRGGLADYSHHQANALVKVGVEVTLLCPTDEEGPWHRTGAEGPAYEVRPALRHWQYPALTGPLRKLLSARNLLADAAALAREARDKDFPRVLFSSFYEYLAPLWAGALRRLSRERGTVFGAIVHDPMRNHIVGPYWWHRWSTALSYSTLREAFVHAPITLDTVRPMPRLRTTVIPQGLYEFPAAKRTRAQWRDEQSLPPDAKVLLSFGHIRDLKNLELVLRTLVRFPQLHLVVAGKEQSSGQKPADFYRHLADELGVGDRCRWMVRFIAEGEVGEIFAGCDLAVMAYSRTFHSASAVLNTAAAFRIPFLASGGEGNLRRQVQECAPDSWIEPDDLEALCAGVSRWLDGAMRAPRWEDYAASNSWQRNAEIVAERMDLI